MNPFVPSFQPAQFLRARALNPPVDVISRALPF